MNGSTAQLTIDTRLNPLELYSDITACESQGQSKHVRLSRVTSAGGGAIAKNEDQTRCVVTGKESLRILQISSSPQAQTVDHRHAIGEGGHRIDSSRNFWDGSGLKIDSASTDVAWGYGQFNNKILTSARNGELIMWDLNKSGNAKYERYKGHSRSINKMSVSQIVYHYCVTCSSDGYLRLWDLRDMTKSIVRVQHPTSAPVRSVIFSPSAWQPFQAVTGLDNGSIYRWDLKMGQRGQLDRLPVAHTASVTSLDWCPVGGVSLKNKSTREESSSGGLGWIVSGGLDRTVKVWDLTATGSNTHISRDATYTLHPSFPVRRVAWRPEHECELAIVSNVEYGNTGDTLMRVTSMMDIGKDKPSSLSEMVPSLGADAIEIWDVRRGCIAKWSVSGSGAEGGVSDVSFGGSDVLWAQHTSGAFTQFDLREVTKPLDAIPHVAITWEATGSMAFVADKKDRWEVPYDDKKPDLPPDAEVRKTSSKALGDPPARVATQVTGYYSPGFLSGDLECFVALARGYIFEAKSREDICAYNSGVALAAGNEPASQVWLLLGASLAEYVPKEPQKSRMASTFTQGEQKCRSESRQCLTECGLPSVLSGRAPSSPSFHRSSPARRSIGGSLSRMPSKSMSRRLTPASSTSPSPRHLPISLPPISPRRTTFFTRGDSVDRSLGRASVIRRPSLTVSLGGPSSLNHSASPSDRNTPSLKHVGEGVLEDSDSSGGSDGDGEGGETAANSSDDDVLMSQPRISPGPGNFGSGMASALKLSIMTPSPLSRTAHREGDGNIGKSTRKRDNDEEDDDEVSSHSPRSTSDTERDSHGWSSPNRRGGSHSRSRSNAGKRMRRVSAGRMAKSRSRSSTVASLAAPPQRPKPLTHQASHSSIRTITAGETPFSDQNIEVLKLELDNNHLEPQRTRHTRQKSATLSEYMLNSSAKGSGANGYAKDIEEIHDEIFMTERRIELIRVEDKRIRDATLAILKKALEEFAEEGDVQMCSMLSLVAPKELGIPKNRVIRFLDSYIEILTRLRLHTCAAYLRKSCGMEEVRSGTLLGTTIYTACGKCKKPLMVPIGSARAADLNRGRYAYCSTCQAPCVMCSICRLPVRAMLFQCSICHHGGHQLCYRNYYMQCPMIDLPTSYLPPTSDVRVGRQSARPTPPPLPPPSTLSTSSLIDDDSASTVSMQSSTHEASTTDSRGEEVSQLTKLKGYPCAAGCGHFCWASSGRFDEF